MATITLSTKFAEENEDFVAIPRKEYEELLNLRLKKIPEIELTPTQKKQIAQARKSIAKGNFLTLDELKQKLGLSR